MQRERFIGEFRSYLLRTYAIGAAAYCGAAITYLPIRESSDGTKVGVVTRLARAGAPTMSVEYRLHRSGGSWKVYDFVIDGISFTLTYRASFAAVLRKSGLDALVERLIEKNRQTGSRPIVRSTALRGAGLGRYRVATGVE